MQVVEQIRLKKADAQKRKLAELYSVTACTGFRPQDQVNHDSYVQQLQAFQDANDLQQGRLFVESSLPPRRQITRTLSTTSAHQTQLPLDTPLKTLRRSKSPPNRVLQSSRTGSLQPVSRPESPRSHAPSRPTSTRPPDDVKSGARPSVQPDAPSNGIVPQPAGRASDIAIAQDGENTPAADSEANVLQPPNKQRPKTPIIPPPVETQDAQSSPTSSNGRQPSHTPAPEAASPTTSPGDETAPTLDIMNTKAPEPHKDGPQTPEMVIAPIHKMSISSIDVDMIDVDPSTAFDSPVQPSKHPPPSPRDTKPQKPSISVDTRNEQKSYFDARQNAGIVETPGLMPSHDASKQTPVTTPAIDPARRATRIQSGVLQKKSVSEILGETPRSASPNESPASVSARAVEKERKDKERSRLSTVVFAKPQRPNVESDTIEVARVDQPSNELANSEEKDYMYTLFESKAHSQNRQGSLSYLLQHSHKTLSTSDHLVDYQYQAHCRVLKRLYQLQNLDKWSLRQRKRAEEPARPTSHWDFLLDHAKWMRTDFREERRWKLAAARSVAESCAEWVAASPADRKALQVRVRPPRLADVEMTNDSSDHISSPPGLEPHGEDDSVSEDIADPRDVVSSIAPAAIFSLGASDFTFTTEKTPAFDKLLNELPLYQPVKVEPDQAKSNLAEKLDSRWKTDIVPVSRYATDKLKVKDYKPPLKRSRYDYNVDDSPPSKRPALEPRETGVALFMPENKHVRDRIHPGHAFRPPSEHPMPSQAFFETRMSSQWLASEDDEVRRQAREYSFNWTLISELMTPPTLYNSGQDRRSAWECFERWIGLEGMPADMAKIPYFKTYSNRIETAQRNVQAQWEEHERRNGTTPVSNRKKTTLPVRVERKHNRRHLFMLDAMRKLAKKREAVRQKAMHSADMAATRKSNDVHAPRPGMKTPAEWSQLKYEREQKMAKQQEMYKQQLIAHQRAVVQQQRGGQNGTSTGLPVPPQASSQMRIGPNGAPIPGMPNGHPQVPNGQPRPPPNMMGMPPGMGMPAGMIGPKGIPQQMAGMRGGMAGSPQQIKMQQEQLLRQAQANGSHSSPNTQQASMANGQNVNNSAVFMNAMNGANGQGSPSATGNTASPRPLSSHMPQSLSSGSMPKINQLYASIKERNPTMSDDEVRNIATQQLVSWQQQATAAAAGNVSRPKVNQAALNAAMGAANSGAFAASQNANAMNMNSGLNSSAPVNQGIMSYEQAQQYHQRMRMQQAQQNAARGMPAPLGPGMTNSPVMNMARPVSQHSQAGIGPGINRSSATPAREQRSGSVSTAVNGAQPGQSQTPAPSQGQGQHSSPRPNPSTPMPT
ncbi:RNA polymerase II transcription elongation factor SpEAF [Knufia obscura]|uniref:Vacuolar import and degradation protein 21 n=1 Tax=Knufia obscura TaxID=1635080 RepID=A0ABR0RST4_9EURO|nr:RNA polymerase II transcription elongation factor SpEAF [Knufia obscura]